MKQNLTRRAKKIQWNLAKEQFIKGMWVNCMKFSPYLKPEEFATARKGRLGGNTDASQPRLVWGKRIEVAKIQYTSLVSSMMAQPQAVQCQEIFFLLPADDVKTRLMATKEIEIKISKGSLYFARFKAVSINFSIIHPCTIC